MGTTFPVSPNSMDFAAFSYTMGKLWRNLCISHMMKYTTGCNQMGKTHSYYGKSMTANFPRSPHTMGFIAFSRAMKN